MLQCIALPSVLIQGNLLNSYVKHLQRYYSQVSSWTTHSAHFLLFPYKKIEPS